MPSSRRAIRWRPSSALAPPSNPLYLRAPHPCPNLPLHKGNSLGAVGEKIRGTFTVKEHGERDGVKQTILQRPRNIEVIS